MLKHIIVYISLNSQPSTRDVGFLIFLRMTQDDIYMYINQHEIGYSKRVVWHF